MPWHMYYTDSTPKTSPIITSEDSTPVYTDPMTCKFIVMFSRY